jgi:hypothetical protein
LPTATPLPTAAPVLPPPRQFPIALEYFLILLGLMLSSLVGAWSGVKVAVAPDAPPSAWADGFSVALPQMLFLPLGVMLLWPLFFLVQKLSGRKQGVTAGEWLWGLAFLASIVIVGIILWRALGEGPGFLTASSFKKNFLLVYMLYALGMALVSLVILIISALGRWVTPWTHTFGLVLLLWPAMPLALLWLSGWKFE